MKKNTPDKSVYYETDLRNLSDFFEFMDNSHRGFSKKDYEKARVDMKYRIKIMEMEKASREGNTPLKLIKGSLKFISTIILALIVMYIVLYFAILYTDPFAIFVFLLAILMSPRFLASTVRRSFGIRDDNFIRFSYEENEKEAHNFLNKAESILNQTETIYGPIPEDSPPYKRIKNIQFSLWRLKKSKTIGFSVPIAEVIYNRAAISLREDLKELDNHTIGKTNKLKDLDPVHIEPVTVPAEPTLSPTEEYKRILDEYLFMEMSSSTVIEAPALLDVTVPEVEAFHKQKSITEIEKARDPDSSQFRKEVKKLDDLWSKAQDKAYAIGLNGLNRAEKRRAHHLLDQIIYAVNDNESDNAKRNLLALIDKITYVTGNGTVRHININQSHILDKVFTKEIAS